MRCSRKRTFNSMYNILQRFENTSILNRLQRIENDGVESPRFSFRSPFFDRVHLLLRVIRCGKLFQRNLLKMIRTFSTNAYTRLSELIGETLWDTRMAANQNTGRNGAGREPKVRCYKILTASQGVKVEV